MTISECCRHCGKQVKDRSGSERPNLRRHEERCVAQQKRKGRDGKPKRRTFIRRPASAAGSDWCQRESREEGDSE